MSAPFHYTGVIPILATPFNDDESLDLDSLARVIRFNAAAGVDGVTILGLLGESNRLTDADRERIIRTAVAAADGLPVIVGTSHTGTASTIEHSRQALDLGATALMITASAQPAPSDKVVFDYFQRIAAQITAPIVLQDHPAITGVHMPGDLILKLVREIPNIVSIKAESLPSPQKIAVLKAGMATGRSATILTGLGGLYGFFDLERGSDGFNTGFAFPEVLLAIVREFRAKNTAGALRIFTKYLPLLVFEQQPGVAIRKEILRRRGLLASNRVRHPGGSIDAGTTDQLVRLLQATFGDADLAQPLTISA
ncbi:MAG: dihydrodipicolinate synthase family protein [Verrucomicrobiota bacterium]